MVKNYIKRTAMAIAVAFTCMGMNAAESLGVTFNGTDNANWEAKVASWTVADGHIQADMDLQTNGKYRGDLKFNKANSADVTVSLDPTKDKILAVKFIGTRPNGALKMEMKTAGDVWYNKQWNGGNPTSVATTNGNYIYYFDLTKEATYTAETSPVSIKQINFVIADAVAEPYSYTIDWIATFASVEDLQSNKDWADDGTADKDEYVMPVIKNETTGAGYSDFQSAINEASNDDVLTLNKPISINSRVNLIEEKAVTIKAGNDEAVITRGANNSIMFLIQKKGHITFDGVTIDGGGEAMQSKYPVIEASTGGGIVTLKNSTIKNSYVITTKQGSVVSKGEGFAEIVDSKFENCKTTLDEVEYGVIFDGTSNVTLEGNNTFTSCSPAIFMESTHYIKAKNLTNTTPITLMVDAGRNLETGKLAVQGWNVVSNFAVLSDTLSLKAEGEDLVFEVPTTGVADVKKAQMTVRGMEGAIAVETPAMMTVNVYSVDGRLVRKAVVEGAATIDGLNAGMYIVNKTKVVVK